MPLTLVAGPGRAGRSVGLALARLGTEVWLLGRRRGGWQAWARRQEIRPVLTLPEAGLAAARVILAVPDAALAPVAAEMAQRLRPAGSRGALAAHLSGLHGLAPLRPLAREGFGVAALHPLVSFAEGAAGADGLHGARVTVLAEGAARPAAFRLVRRWGARPLAFPAGADRRRYHLALALAANHAAALADWATSLLEPVLGSEAAPAVHDLATAALGAVRGRGGARALTGPVVRGDLETLAAHFRALRGRERARYAGSLLAVADLAEASGRLDSRGAQAVRRLARRHLPRPGASG